MLHRHLLKAPAEINLEKIEAMIEAGADLRRPDHQGKIPLVRAVEQGNADIANAMLASDPGLLKDPDIAGDVLLAMLDKGACDTDFAVKLVRNGSNLRRRDMQGNTPLILAAARGHTHVALAIAKADPEGITLVNDAGSDAAMWAAFSNDTEVLQAVWKGDNVNRVTENGDSAVVLAKMMQASVALKWLRDNGADSGPEKPSRKPPQNSL